MSSIPSLINDINASAKISGARTQLLLDFETNKWVFQILENVISSIAQFVDKVNLKLATKGIPLKGRSDIKFADGQREDQTGTENDFAVDLDLEMQALDGARQAVDYKKQLGKTPLQAFNFLRFLEQRIDHLKSQGVPFANQDFNINADIRKNDAFGALAYAIKRKLEENQNIVHVIIGTGYTVFIGKKFQPEDLKFEESIMTEDWKTKASEVLELTKHQLIEGGKRPNDNVNDYLSGGHTEDTGFKVTANYIAKQVQSDGAHLGSIRESLEKYLPHAHIKTFSMKDLKESHLFNLDSAKGASPKITNEEIVAAAKGELPGQDGKKDIAAQLLCIFQVERVATRVREVIQANGLTIPEDIHLLSFDGGLAKALLSVRGAQDMLIETVFGYQVRTSRNFNYFCDNLPFDGIPLIFKSESEVNAKESEQESPANM